VLFRSTASGARFAPIAQVDCSSGASSGTNRDVDNHAQASAALAQVPWIEPRMVMPASQRNVALRVPELEVSDEGLFALVFRQTRALAGWKQADLDDLVQAAAEQVTRSLPSFAGDCELSTWTWQICYRTVLKHRRWYRRWLRRFAMTNDGTVPESRCEETPSDLSERNERIARLGTVIASLSPKRRTVVVLHDLEGVHVADIARIVGANLLTVRSRLRDGRRDLARRLRNDPYFGDEACHTEERT
jgi:RNA polymerase sigma factor (sigma-70 family)